MPELYPYQQKASDAVMSELSRRDAALVVMPTGTGKTYTAMDFIAKLARNGQRVLVVAHMGELLTQWAEACDAFGLTWAVEKAEQRARGDSLFGRVDVVLGSKDSMQGKRLLTWPENHFGTIVCDEAHHGVASTYMKLWGHFAKAKRVGLTATPERGDGEDIQRVFGNCVFEYPLWAAIEDGYLVPPLFRRPATPIDLSKIKSSGSDLNKGDLEDEISKHIEELVNSAKKEIADRYTMTFTPDVGSAQAMSDGFRQVGIAARSVHGKSEDRHTVIKEFKSRDYQALCSCAMLLEGFDAKHVSALGMARPTKSSTLYRQMLGRGLRTYEGKTHCLVVDWAWNSGQHDLFRPIDLFDTSGMDLQVLKIADDLIREGKQEDPREALREAEKIHQKQLAARVTVREREPRYKMIAFDPFMVGSLLGIPNRHVEGKGAPCNKKNTEKLKALKLEPGTMTNKEAKTLLDELEARRAQGLATHRMVSLLVSKGVPAEQARAMPFNDARGDLDLIMTPTDTYRMPSPVTWDPARGVWESKIPF